MLALTYPPGARVHRCQDYAPQIKIDNLNENLNDENDDDEDEDEDDDEDFSPASDDSRGRTDRRPPQRRRRRRRPPLRRESPDLSEPPSALGPTPASPQREADASPSSRLLAGRNRASSQPSANEPSAGTNARESCPRDRSQPLRIALILALLLIGCNRHSTGPPLAALALGSFLRGACALPIPLTLANNPPQIDAADPGVRSERSANLSHITGTSRKIQMYVKNRHLQILPDGTVNGSNDDTSDFTILQRSSVSRGQLKIQGVATCLYLCMDSCGLLYGSREYTEDCVFNETMEQHNYNTYSSIRWSTPRKTLYLGLSRQGQPRRVQAKGHNLGRLSAYARVLTQVVAPDRVEGLHQRMLGARHNVRHHHGSQQAACPVQTPQEKDGRDKFRCRKRKKRKKRRRRCRPGELPGPQCDARETPLDAAQSKRSCEGAAGDEACRREALETPAKKRKSRIDVDEELDEEEVAGVERKARRSNVKKGKEAGGAGGKKNGGKRQQQQQQQQQQRNHHHHHQNPGGSGNKKGGGGGGGGSPWHRGKKGGGDGKGGGGKNQRNGGGSKRKGGGGGQRFPRTTSRASSGAVTSAFSWSAGATTSPSAVERIATPSSLFRENRGKGWSRGINSGVSIASTLSLTSTTAAAVGIGVLNRMRSIATIGGESSNGEEDTTASGLSDISKPIKNGDENEADQLLDFNDFEEDDELIEEERDDDDEDIADEETVATVNNPIVRSTATGIDKTKFETDQRLAM